MASGLSKLSRDRLQGVHPDRVRWSSARSRSRPRTSGVQEGLRTRERKAELVARGASRTINSRHLTGHAVDLVALNGGEVSWVAAAMQARRMSLRCRCVGAAAGIRSW